MIRHRLISVLFVAAVSMSLEAAEKKPAEATKPASAKKTGKKYPPIDPSKGILEGRIFLKGKAPAVKELVVPKGNQDHGFCVKHAKSEELIVGKEGVLMNAVISVGSYKAKFKGHQRPKPRVATIDNKNCLFVPHVMATTVGATLRMHNSDKFIHNCRGNLKPLRGINSAIAPNDSKDKKLRYPGWGVMLCDYHPWMKAHVHVFAHPFFDVSAKDGTYKIVNIPPGTYEIEVWHEKLAPYRKTQKRKITLEAGKTAKLDVHLEPLKLSK